MRRLTTRSPGPIGIALTAWEVWRRIPKRYRRAMIRQAAIYGPALARSAMEYQRRRRKR
jgi:hypothetical protein